MDHWPLPFPVGNKHHRPILVRDFTRLAVENAIGPFVGNDDIRKSRDMKHFGKPLPLHSCYVNPATRVGAQKARITWPRRITDLAELVLYIGRFFEHHQQRFALLLCHPVGHRVVLQPRLAGRGPSSQKSNKREICGYFLDNHFEFLQNLPAATGAGEQGDPVRIDCGAACGGRGGFAGPSRTKGRSFGQVG